MNNKEKWEDEIAMHAVVRRPVLEHVPCGVCTSKRLSESLTGHVKELKIHIYIFKSSV